MIAIYSSLVAIANMALMLVSATSTSACCFLLLNGTFPFWPLQLKCVYIQLQCQKLRNVSFDLIHVLYISINIILLVILWRIQWNWGYFLCSTSRPLISTSILIKADIKGRSILHQLASHRCEKCFLIKWLPLTHPDNYRPLSWWPSFASWSGELGEIKCHPCQVDAD